METVTYAGAVRTHAEAVDCAAELLQSEANVDRVRIHRDPLEKSSRGWPWAAYPWNIDGLQVVAEPCS